jgi:hypothetical protein
MAGEFDEKVNEKRLEKEELCLNCRMKLKLLDFLVI